MKKIPLTIAIIILIGAPGPVWIKRVAIVLGIGLVYMFIKRVLSKDSKSLPEDELPESLRDLRIPEIDVIKHLDDIYPELDDEIVSEEQQEEDLFYSNGPQPTEMNDGEEVIYVPDPTGRRRDYVRDDGIKVKFY